MDIWITFHNNSQMANNLVKWWKTKFLNGYKQFSVECGDSKVSDTEELLAKVGSEETISEKLENCTTPPLQPQVHPDTPTPTEESTPKKHQFNFEEFSCDVAVENSNNKCGQDRQEFSFTLYDFDGHGKITKDDIAGLVTTIYEALGSSVKVPHYGSKTIKVKLTVSPDQRKQVSATIINQGDDDNQKDKTKNEVHYKRDLNVTIRQRTNRRKHCKKQSNKQKPKKTTAPAHHHCCNKQDDDDVFVSDDSSDAGSRLSSSEDDERECSDHEQTNRVKKCQKKTKYTIPNILIKDTCNEEVCSKMRAIKKRSGSLQRQELLEIIQANMDKNNLSFQTMRKHSKHVSTDVKKTRHHHKASQKMSTSPLQYLATIVDPTHFYVDLASLQNTTQLPQTQCQYDKLINAVMCVSNKTNCVKKPLKCSRKYSRVQNPVHYQLLQYPLMKDENTKKTPKRISAGPGVNLKTAKNHMETETGMGVHATLSPHHLRHRNRQEDQARAMSQVVRWLEQEFSSTLHASNNTQEKTKQNHFSHSSHKEKTNTTPSTPTSGVERHEHHHVHEHIHHHYHHYPETPLVV